MAYAHASARLIGGLLDAVGADFWKALKTSIRLLRKRRRPAKRSVVLLTLHNQAGGEVLILVHPDDPLEALNDLEVHVFTPPSEDVDAVMLSWDKGSQRWMITKVAHT